MADEEKELDGTITLEEFEKDFGSRKIKEVMVWKSADLHKYYSREFELPDNYEIHITSYEHTGPENYWEVLKIEIFKDDKFYIGFGRDYHAFNQDQFVYLKQTGDDGIEREFVITTSQYMFTTIINLTDKTIKSYTFGSPNLGAGFCPTRFSYEKEMSFPDGDYYPNELMIEGCYWACPYERYYIKDIDFNKDLTDVFSEDNPNVTRTDDEGNPYEDYEFGDNDDGGWSSDE